MRLAICITTGGTIHSDTVTCLLSALTQTPVEKYTNILTGGYKPYSLTLAVQAAKNNTASHILFIDNDVLFSPNAIMTLINHNKDIVGANYNERRFPLQATVKMADEHGQLIGKQWDHMTEMFKAYSVGFGFVLVNMSVFDKLEKPYFNAPMDTDDTFMTDDFYFFDKCQKKGIEVWCDPTISVKHLGLYAY